MEHPVRGSTESQKKPLAVSWLYTSDSSITMFMWSLFISSWTSVSGMPASGLRSTPRAHWKVGTARTSSALPRSGKA